MTAAAQARLATDPEPAGPIGHGVRLTAIDMLRGLVIVLMVLDHTRDYFMTGAFFTNAVDPQTSYPALYVTRWITHLCAPSFVFLAGTSAFLKGARDGDMKSLSWFLFSRGLWLIVLELTVVNLGWNFGISGILMQVIWAIGAGMIVLAGLIWAGPRVVLAIGILIVAGHNLLDPVDRMTGPEADLLWAFVHEDKFITPGGLPMFLAYPFLPWLGIMCLGYGLGSVFLKAKGERIRTFVFFGLAFIAAFLALRFLNGYGDPTPWKTFDDPARTAMSFFNVEKYPPSLMYALATLGPSFLLLALFERLKGPVAEFFLTYGRVPLFVYVLHIYLIHALQIAVGVAMGFRVEQFIKVFEDPSKQQGWGFDLPVVWLVWLVVLAVLFPLARWFGAVKRKRKDWWLSYL